MYTYAHLCTYMLCVQMCIHEQIGAHGAQKRESKTLEMESHQVVSTQSGAGN